MKKRIISLLLASAMLLSMTSCYKKEQNLDVEKMTLEEYIEAVELPKNLTISIDPATVEERETMKIYDNVEYMDFDDEALIKALFKNPVTEKSPGEITEYLAETDTQKEVLNTADFGYLSYWWNPNTKYQIAFALEYHSQLYSYNVQEVQRRLLGVFNNTDKTLDFASREEIAEKAASFFRNIGMSQVEVHEMMAYDVDVLDAQKYTEPKKEDEYYVVLCRQLIDGIPINTYSLRVTGNDVPWEAAVKMYVAYNSSGIKEVFTCNLLEEPTPDEATEAEILSASSALESVKEYYGKAILSKEYTIEDMELTYIEYPNEDQQSVTLKPYWLVKVGYQQQYSETDEFKHPLEGELKAYDFLYFDAVTGEYFEGSPSGKPVE